MANLLLLTVAEQFKTDLQTLSSTCTYRNLTMYLTIRSRIWSYAPVLHSLPITLKNNTVLFETWIITTLCFKQQLFCYTEWYFPAVTYKNKCLYSYIRPGYWTVKRVAQRRLKTFTCYNDVCKNFALLCCSWFFEVLKIQHF